MTTVPEITVGSTPPVNPTTGDLWWNAGQLYVWDNTQWVITGGSAGGTATVGDVPPSSPNQGDAWFSTTDGQLYIRFVDATSAQWVIAVNQAGPQGPQGPPGRPGTSFYPGGPGGPALPTPDKICELPNYLSARGLDSLYDHIQVQMPGVTSDNVVMQAWTAVADFYTASTYRREHVFWRMDPGVVTLSFDPWDSHWRPFRFLYFRGLSNPKFEPPGRIRDLTWPLPDTTRNGEVVLALRPTDINTDLGEDFWAMWFDAVLAGSLARLYLQPGKPYSDAGMGRVQRQIFTSGVAQARAHVQSGFVTDGVLWRFPYFASGHSKNGGWGGPG